MIQDINKFTKIGRSFVHILCAVWIVGGLLVASLAMNVAYTALSSAGSTGGNQWQIQQSYLAPVNNFNSVSCPSSSVCFAVGDNSVGGPAVYETTDGGTSWSNSTASISPSLIGVLSGISCVSQTFCEAVGSDYANSTGIAVGYNGTTWSSQTVPSGIPGLFGISCVSQTFCEAVGSTTLITYNGSTWSSQTAPAGVSVLNGISCVSQTFCEAVGSTTLITYNGTGWLTQTSPSGISSLSGVSCVSSTFCEAVGDDFTNNTPTTVVYNGSTWSTQTLPTGVSSLDSVSCTSGSGSSGEFCEAVGYNYNGSTGQLTDVAVGYNGSTWSSQTVPSGLSALFGLSCVSQTFCEATGTGVAIGYDGTTWSAQTLPQGLLSLYGIACATQTFCEAGGSASLTVYNGSTWSTQTLPTGVSLIISVSCISTAFCVALGAAYSLPGQTVTPIATVYNGSTWSTQTLPSGVPVLNSVSCVSQTFCEAVGANSGTSPTPVAAAYNGSTWSTQTLPTGVSYLNAISCVSQTFCEAVGNNYANTSTTIGVTYNGSTWSIQTLPSGISSLSGISCVSQTFCEAVGNHYNSSTGTTTGAATVYNGSTWSIQTLPSGVSPLNSVSCVSGSGSSSDFCEAVGNNISSGVSMTANALSYNGATWSSEPLPSGISSLSDVSCVSSTFCEAVGSTNRYIVILSTAPTSAPTSAPTLSSISPTSGPAAGGTTVTLTGTGFSTAQGGTTVLFGSTAATSVSCSSTTSCSALSPPAPSGATLPDTVQVSVTVSSGTSDWMAYTYLPSTPQTGTNYYPLVPYRICDSRTPKGSSILQNQCNINGASPVGANQTLNIEVSGYKSPYLAPGETPVPTTASAVVLNITAIDPTASGYLTVWPAGEVKPTASLLNYTSGETVPNLSEVALGTTTSCTGCISIYSYASSDVVVDVEGYYGPPSGGATFSPITPYRICDTRVPKASSILQNQCNINGSSPVGAKQTLNIKVSGYNSPYLPSGETPVPTTASAVVLNVTAIDPTTSGYLTVWPEGLSQPTASNLNFRAGQTVPNAVVVPLSTGSSPGEISIYNFYGNTDVTVDVTGYFSTSTTGVSFVGTAPYRACDTRDATMVGYATPCSGSPLVSSTPLTLSLAGIGPIPSNAKAVVVNVTAINPTASGYITVWPEGLSQPTVSNLNFVAGEVVANSVTVALSASGDISIGLYQGSANLVVDVTGWYV
ncbi:MAG: IPT/TIG domain-containing protein [Actinobacteria bacterium]|nr:IPT/TIG domain-containing protein [Actinomycetota bacterium]